MTAEADIAAIADGGANPPSRVRTALTSVLGRADGVWQDWTPTWTAATTNPVIGDGVLTGRYVTYGDTVIGNFYMEAGASTTFGTGGWRFSLPVAPLIPDNDLSYALGTVSAANIDSRAHVDVARISVVSTVPYITLVVVGIGGGTGIPYASNVPFSWTTGDFLSVQFTYEAA